MLITKFQISYIGIISMISLISFNLYKYRQRERERVRELEQEHERKLKICGIYNFNEFSKSNSTDPIWTINDNKLKFT